MRKKYSMILLVVVFLLITGARLEAGNTVSAEKKTEILELMKLTRTRDLALEMKNRVISALRQSFPDAPESYWENLKKRIKEKILLDNFIPVYDRYLSLGDIRHLIAFYKTPAGRHYLAVKETMVLESVQEGKKWAMGWILTVFKELKGRGYKPARKLDSKGDASKTSPPVDSKPRS
jgi:hypothetical protein